MCAKGKKTEVETLFTLLMLFTPSEYDSSAKSFAKLINLLAHINLFSEIPHR